MSLHFLFCNSDNLAISKYFTVKKLSSFTPNILDGLYSTVFKTISISLGGNYFAPTLVAGCFYLAIVYLITFVISFPIPLDAPVIKTILDIFKSPF